MAAEKLQFKSTLDASEFERTLRRMEEQGKAAASRLSATGTAFAKVMISPIMAIGPAIAAAFSTQAIAAGVARTFAAGRGLQQMARATGASVQGLAILQSKFKMAGLEGEKASTAIFRLQKSIAGIEDEENKGGSKALERLGLNMAAIRKLTPDQQLMAVGRAISTIQNPAQRTAVAMQIFGRAGAELGAVFSGPGFGNISPMLQQKAEMMARNSAEFEKASINLERAGKLFESFYTGFAGGIVGQLNPVLDKVAAVNLAEQGRLFGEGIAKGASALEAAVNIAHGFAKTDMGVPGLVKTAASAIAAPVTTPFAFAGLAAQGIEHLAAINEATKLSGVLAARLGRFGAAHPGSAARPKAAPVDPDSAYDVGVAGTDRRAETKAVNNRPLSIAIPRPLTLPAAVSRSQSMPASVHAMIAAAVATRSGVGGAGGAGRIGETSQLGAAMHSIRGGPPRGQHDAGTPTAAALSSPAGPYALPTSVAAHLALGGAGAAVGSGVAGVGRHVAAAMARAGAGASLSAGSVALDSRLRSSWEANHGFGQTALDFDPSTRKGWTGAHNATTRGGLGGGAYGRTSNVMTQISGRVSGGGDPAADTAKNTGTIAQKMDDLLQVWGGKGSGSGKGSGGGATAAK